MENSACLTTTGVKCNSWVQPADWVTTAVHGVTGYWVRALCTVPGGAITVPQQGNRDIYTTLKNWVQLDADEVGGDMPAWGQVHLWDNGGNTGATCINRVIMGLRSVARGSEFESIWPLADEQMPVGITAALTHASASWASHNYAASGRCMQWAPAAAVAITEVGLVYSSYARRINYKGRFHIYLRCQQTNGAAGDISVRLRFAPYWFGFTTFSTGEFLTETKTLAYTQSWELVDFGTWTLLPDDVGLAAEMNTPAIRIEMSNNVAAARTIRLYDVILIPADEWFGVWEENSDPTLRLYAEGLGNNRLECYYIPKVPITASSNFLTSTSRLRDLSYTVYAASPLGVAPRRAMRLHFLFGMTVGAPSPGQIRQYCPGCITRVALSKIQRYKFARGRR